MRVALCEETILNAQAVTDKAGDEAKKELAALIKALQEAKMTAFAKPLRRNHSWSAVKGRPARSDEQSRVRGR